MPHTSSHESGSIQRDEKANTITMRTKRSGKRSSIRVVNETKGGRLSIKPESVVEIDSEQYSCDGNLNINTKLCKNRKLTEKSVRVRKCDPKNLKLCLCRKETLMYVRDRATIYKHNTRRAKLFALHADFCPMSDCKERFLHYRLDKNQPPIMHKCVPLSATWVDLLPSKRSLGCYFIRARSSTNSLKQAPVVSQPSDVLLLSRCDDDFNKVAMENNIVIEEDGKIMLKPRQKCCKTKRRRNIAHSNRGDLEAGKEAPSAKPSTDWSIPLTIIYRTFMILAAIALYIAIIYLAGDCYSTQDKNLMSDREKTAANTLKIWLLIFTSILLVRQIMCVISVIFINPLSSVKQGLRGLVEDWHECTDVNIEYITAWWREVLITIPSCIVKCLLVCALIAGTCIEFGFFEKSDFVHDCHILYDIAFWIIIISWSYICLSILSKLAVTLVMIIVIYRRDRFYGDWLFEHKQVERDWRANALIFNDRVKTLGFTEISNVPILEFPMHQNTPIVRAIANANVIKMHAYHRVLPTTADGTNSDRLGEKVDQLATSQNGDNDA